MYMSFLHAAFAPKIRAPRASSLTMPNKGRRHAAVPSPGPGPSLAGSVRLRRFLPFAVVVVAMAVILAMGWHRQLSFETLVRHRAGIDAFVAEHYAAAVAAFVALYVAVAALSVPGAAVLTICGGILFGWLVGGLAAIAGATAGATIIFSIARTACGESLLRCAGSRAQSIAEGFRSDAFSYLLFLRLVPLFPFWLVNLAPALVGVRLATFVGATALGIVPGTFAYALVGEGLDSVIRAEGAAFRACLAAGNSDCRLDFDMAAALTPQLLAAFVALGLIALIPILLRRRRARNAANP
jgi:uncharacterized membrane protein YdjX (TVP38/TMEM64 family)